MDWLDPLDKILGIRHKAKAKPHTLKWKVPESRITLEVKDAQDVVYTLEKKLKCPFLGGGEYSEMVHAKDYGNGTFAYMMLRTDKKTQAETLVADAYMLQEDEPLGFEATSGFRMEESLEALGYAAAFPREFTVWSFRYLTLPVRAYSIKEYGDFVEIAIPATNVDSVREKNEKLAFTLVEKLGFKKEAAIPTDVITLELEDMMQAQQKQQAARR